ncbi:hypothetical protein GOP47_0020057 [Adiantum capillus-veneris]|uniref:Cytochrome f n=1 Tax=Adiantum capillus-veneris TaxID=13818 RepID=A0A9D4Z968_ADICA|nr:hypothetical protein GOP47_0020057 [Adiantum capillus-veneris]
MQTAITKKWMKEWWILSLAALISFGKLSCPSVSNAYPIFAQQNYENPREATGPVPGKLYSEIIFPVLSPDPGTNKEAHFLKYPIYVGGNRGRGQIYPDGSKSNNTVYTASATGKIKRITRKEGKGGYEIIIEESSGGREAIDVVPPGPELIVSGGEFVKADQPLTNNPNVGGFGQGEVEIVLQDPRRIQGLLAFFASVVLAQIFLVLKKKQFEKVQLAEMNF